MSTHGPHDSSETEYLSEQETARPSSSSGRKRALVGLGAVAMLALGGAGAYGVMQFMSSGDSAATAVPDHALGYLALDLDPSGGQKVAAYETMRKFPALKEQLGLDSDDDPRRWVVDALNNGAGCSLDFDDDVAPWLGHKVAFSAVDGEGEPEPFLVLEVTDTEAAESGVATLFECGDEEEYGTAMVGDFMVVAPDAELAEDIAADAEDSALADDETFEARMDDAGDQGIVTGYLAPAAVDLMLEQAEEMGSSSGSARGISPGTEPAFGIESEGDVPEAGMDDMVPAVDGAQLDLVRDWFEDFDGAAMQVRFADAGLEMEMIASGIKQLEDLEPGASGMEDLPGSTAIAYGLAVSPEMVGMMEDSFKGQMSDAEYDAQIQQFEQQTGLAFPEDVQTLLGDGLSLAVDGSIDVKALGQAFVSGQTAGVDIPVGLRILSEDTGAVVEVTDKLQGLIPPGMPVSMEVEEGDGAVAVGADADYVGELAGDGDLGETEAFEKAVPDAEQSVGGFYVDFDADSWLEELVGQEDPETLANVEPLSSLGASGSVDDDHVSMLLRLTTD